MPAERRPASVDPLVTRRRFLGLAGGGAGAAALAAAGYVGYIWPHSTSATVATTASRGKESATPDLGPDAGAASQFVSRPDLRPPAVVVTHRSPPGASVATTPSEYVVVSPKGYDIGPGQPGLMVLDEHGTLVWFAPRTGLHEVPSDLQIQTYQGKSVLTWWQGTQTSGHGQGRGYVADSSYRTIAEVRAGNGLQVDAHELNLTPQGTALITAYRTATTDLSSIGGSKRGKVFAGQAQEIDVATGKMLFSWDSLDHVPVTESHTPLPSGTATMDYFHINSVSLAEVGNLLISSRDTRTICKVDRRSGAVIWRLGGKRSDFTLGPGCHFYWQHHVRAHPDNRITVFDDGASPKEEPQSRGLVLSVDESTMQVKLLKAFEHPARLLAANQGSMQLLSDGGAFVGWGNQPYFSRFASDGSLVLDGRFPADDQSYRAFLMPWDGHPTAPPDLAVRRDSIGGVTAYVSWNGATGVDRWRILAGKRASSLRSVAVGYRSGFETEIAVDDSGPYFTAAALDASGSMTGKSATILLA